jgi:hypothetical protein
MQLVINLPFRSLREIALKQSAKSKRRKEFTSLKARVIYYLPLSLIIFGLVGLGYSIPKLSTHPALKPIPISYSIPVQETETSNSNTNSSLNRSAPVQISANSVGINYPVEKVGLLSDGSLETPSIWDDVTGWYKNGPSPGEIGPAVIVGHIDNIYGPSVFWRLRELAPGDKINVTRKDGKVVVFKVQSIQEYDKNKFPTKKVYGPQDYPALRLITCGGNYSASSDTYTHNTVVYAKMVSFKS